MNYKPGRNAVSVCQTSHTACSICSTQYGLGWTERNGITTFDANGIFTGAVDVIQVTPHKIFHTEAIRSTYDLMTKYQNSAEQAAAAYNSRCAQTPLQSIHRDTSPLHCRALQKDLLPESLNNSGAQGTAAEMTPDDAQKIFLIWAAVARAQRFGESTFRFSSAEKDARFGKYRGLVFYLAAHFSLHGMYGVKGHLCSDCCFKASTGDGIITNAVFDGVSATCPICSFEYCGEELKNMHTDRFCPAHDDLHYKCGVMEGPGNKDPCGKATSSKSLHSTGSGVPGATGAGHSANPPLADPVHSKDAWKKRRVTCDEHEWLERIWRDDRTLSEDYTASVRLRKAKMRAARNTSRLSDPIASDHCISGGGSSASGCKGAWILASECGGDETQVVREYRVNFKRHYAYVYVVCMFPCGLTVHSKFFPRAESPQEFIDFVIECFPDIKDMPSITWFDAACRVAPTVFLASGKHRKHFERFKKTGIFVPPIHQKSHTENDEFCDEFCNADRFAETFLRGPQGQREYKINAAVVEELFSWLGNFETSVRSMKKSFAEVFYKVVLDEKNAGIEATGVLTGARVHDAGGRRVKAKVYSNLSLKRGRIQKKNR